MTADPIYLDHNATTPLLPEVLEAMLPFLREHFGNPSSKHWYGQRTRAAVEQARSQVAALIGCEPDELFFTSGGTEANNLAIHGVAQARSDRRGLVTTQIDHPSTLKVCNLLGERGWSVARLPVDAGGRARVDEAERRVASNTALVTLMHANNETGVVQPVREIAALAHRAGAWVHTDAAQTAGKVPVDVRALDVDLLSLGAHKLYGPKGIGALYVKRGTELVPFVLGAGHERGLRSGTENVPAIVGFGAACEIAVRDLDALGKRLRGLRDELFARLSAAIPGVRLNGDPEHRVPNTLNVRFPGVTGPALLAATPEIAATTGAACHDGRDVASASILALGVPAGEALGSVRLSLGRSTTAEQVAAAAEALVRAWRFLHP